MFKKFESYIYGIIGLNGNLSNMIVNLTNKLIELKRAPNITEIAEIDPDKLVPGRFYLIQYNYNGNFIWCPILALDYKVVKNNHILYAVNLEYLPPKFKITMFDNIFRATNALLEKISNKKTVLEEEPMNFINFEFIYSFLKKYKMNWCITAYTIKKFSGEYKIKKAYVCSLKIAPEIIMSDFKRYNASNMIELQKSLPEKDSMKLSEIIEEYKKIIESYQEDSIEYHKKVAQFEKKFKLFEEND